MNASLDTQCIWTATSGAFRRIVHRLGFLVVVALAGFTARGQDISPAATPPAKTSAPTHSGPRIDFPEPMFDFGSVQSGKIVRHDYVFTNAGNQTLEVTDVWSSCGCAVFTNWSRRVEPGKTGILPVLFDSTGMSGPVRKNLRITSNDPVQPSFILGFSATIRKFIDALPGIAVFNFGPDFQTNQTRVIRLVSNLEDPVMIFPPVCTNRAFQAELKTVRDGKEFELHVSVVPPLGPGSLTVPITMKTSAPEMPLISVNAFALVQPALVVSPPRIIISTPLTEPRTFTVTLRNQSSNAIALSEATINAPGASVQLREVQPGKLFNLIATFPAGFRSPAGQEAEVRLKSTHPQIPIVRIAVFQPEFDDESPTGSSQAAALVEPGSSRK